MLKIHHIVAFQDAHPYLNFLRLDLVKHIVLNPILNLLVNYNVELIVHRYLPIEL